MKEPENIFVGDRLKQLRILKGRTQQEVADFFGISKQAISKWENGQTMPDVLLLPEIAKYFNVSLETFFDHSYTNKVNQPLTNKQIIIEVNDLKKQYNKNDDFVLKGVNLNIYDDCSTAIMGPSGSGKSTLLNCISGLEKFDSGLVNIFGKNIAKLKEPKITKFRRENICFIFQQYNLIGSLNVIDNIKLPYKLNGEKIDKKHLRELIDKLGLKGKEKVLPSKLSGGQQQRVAIARALLGKKRIIFADEPTGALDAKNSQEVLNLLLSACKEFKKPLIIVTHDANVAAKCDIVYFLKDGKFANSLTTPTIEEITNIMLNLQE